MMASKCAARVAGTAALLLLGWTSVLTAGGVGRDAGRPDTTFVHPGDRVRLQAPRISSGRLVGEVTELEGDTLVLLSEGGGSTIAIPTSDLERIAVSQGKKSNAILGLLVGAGVGVASAVGLSIWVCNADDDGCTSGQVVGGALAVTFIGAGLGAGIGALIKTERWREASIPPPPPPIGLGFGRDGSVRLAFSLRL
ncbi:MAG: hypothetical protein P8Y10_08530 [Gemmatimonadales bacterium]|jgi:hypothetical protein